MSRVHILVWLVSIIAILMVIGFIQIRKALIALQDDMAFAYEYRNKLNQFSNILFKQSKFDNDLYNWLTLNVAKMQTDLGYFGNIDLTPAGDNYVTRNYQMLVNTLAEMRTFLSDSYSYNLMGKGSDAATCSDMIVRYYGSLMEQKKPLVQQLCNPLAWLQQGMQFMVTLPISLLYWSGLIQYSAFAGLSQNFFVKSLSFVINLIGLVGSIVTIVTGWNPFIAIYHQWALEG